MERSPQIGYPITDKSAPPDDRAVHGWLGAKAFKHWADLQHWIKACYPGVFAPDWLYGGKKRGWLLRYKKGRAFCTLLPEYRRVSVLVVLGGPERAKFEDRHCIWRPELVELYNAAKTYPDGKWMTVEISCKDDRLDVQKLLAMKPPPRLDG